MNNLIVKEETLSKIILSTTNMLNGFISELGLDDVLKVVVIDEQLEKTTNEFYNKNNKRRDTRNRKKFKIEETPYKDIVNQMLLDGMKYDDIEAFLVSKGEDISRSSVGRYARKFFESIEDNNPPTKGGTF